jgi:hypothetical protein
VEGSSITLDCANASNYNDYGNRSAFSTIDELDGSTSSDSRLARPVRPTSSLAVEQISLILWYKSDLSSRIPFYSVDARHVPVHSARHQSNHSRARTLLAARPSGSRPQLRLWDLQANDSGEYRCRLDFRNQRTQNALFRLKVYGT